MVCALELCAAMLILFLSPGGLVRSEYSIDVWFDEWEIRAGDSIPGKLNEALTALDTLILL